jgi:hypothetical protein
LESKKFFFSFVFTHIFHWRLLTAKFRRTHRMAIIIPFPLWNIPVILLYSSCLWLLIPSWSLWLLTAPT